MSETNGKTNSARSGAAIYVRVLLFSLSFFLFFTSAKALDRNRTINQFHHTAWTARDGAPSQISAITQTEDGYLWIGSALGLFRFDGVTFEQFVPPDGVQLPSYNIYALMATADGGLWISFRPSGLGFLKDGQLKIYSRPEEIPKTQVNCFARTPDGKIWAGTHDGLSLFNGAGWDDIGTDWNFQSSRVRTMFTDRGGTLWVSKNDSIVFLPPGSKTFQTSEKQDDKFVSYFAQAEDGRLWAGRYGDLASPIRGLGSGSAANKPVLHIGAWELLFDRDGDLWMASGGQVSRVRFPEQLEAETIEKNDSRIEVFKDGLSGSSAYKIFEDREGNIWVGTRSGLDRFRYSSIVPVAVPSAAQKLTLAANEQGRIWAGSAELDVLLHQYNERLDQISVTPPLFTSSLYQDADGSNWWGTDGGIRHQRNKNFEFFPSPKDLTEKYIWEIFPAEADGGLWVSFDEVGLIYLKDGVWERRKPPDGLPNRGPSATFQDEQKRIWLGYTENRICFLDGGRVQCYTSADGIEIGRIKVLRGRNGKFWFGGELGLAFFKNDRFYTVKTDGKPFGAVSGIIATENGDVWLNEVRGVVNIPANEIRQLNENPEYNIKYRLYDFQDNLPGGAQMNFTVSTAIEATDKRLWFATDNGLALIDPARLEKNIVPPPVVIKSVLADENLFRSATKINFPAGTANLQISYTATSLSIPERVVFKYRLDGYEDQWHEAGTRREAFYTNLAPGDYRFQVVAANNDGVWNEQGAILEFEILPMFYQTNWFLLVCFAALCVLIWAIYQWRLYLVKSRLHLRYEERLAERTRIAQDLHDTLLQGIVSVSMHLDSAFNKLPPDSPAKSRLERMREMMRQIIEEGRNTVNGLRSSGKLDDGDLEQKISRISQQLNARGNTNFRLAAEGAKRIFRPTIYEEIYHICREALANAFRHSEASSITVEMKYAKKFFKILIRDDGIGIDEYVLKTGREGHWGLSGMKERAEKIGAKLKVYSRTGGGGTEVELIVPGRVAFEAEKSVSNGSWLNKFFPPKNSAAVATKNGGENENPTSDSGFER